MKKNAIFIISILILLTICVGCGNSNVSSISTDADEIKDVNTLPAIRYANVDEIGSFNDFLHSDNAEASGMSLGVINRDIRVDDRVAIYQQVLSGAAELQRYSGELYQQADDCSWYYPVDICNRKYLIQQADSTTSLWKFTSFVVDN